MFELSDDRGAIAVLTAIVGSVVLLACAAFAVDVGTLYSERRQLQNGADAAAIGIAQSCARGIANPANPCDARVGAALADGNAVDRTSEVALICGTAPGLAGCPPADGSRASCPAPPANSPPYVEVHTRTATVDGANLVAPVFARAIPGFGDYRGTSVGACARAGYGSPASAFSILAMTVSTCVIDQYRAQHGAFAPSTLPNSTSAEIRLWESTIQLNYDSGPCMSAAGNFGYLEPGGPCSATTTLSSWFPGRTGNTNPKNLGCTDSYLTSRLGKTNYIPVYDAVTGTGDNARYHIVGYAAFYFTGWRLTSTSHSSTASGRPPCQNPVTCISGAFVYGLQPAPGPISAAPNYGATVVQLIG